MPAHIPKTGALGTKLVTVFATNPRSAAVTSRDDRAARLHDRRAAASWTGATSPKRVPAAVSAVSARLLARGDASTMAILGSGVQARSHLAALTRVRAVRHVRVWSPSTREPPRVRRRDAADDHGGDRETDSPQQAVEGADIVVLATSSREPVVRSEWIDDGAHIAAVGACRPDQREMEAALVARARSSSTRAPVRWRKPETSCSLSARGSIERAAHRR